MNPLCISAHIYHAGKYLLIRRCGKYLTGTWQMVSGGIEPNETAYAAALREIQEETGLTPDALYSADTVETFYMKTLDKVMFCPVFIAFVKDPSPIRLSPKEHDAYEWHPFKEARERLIFSEQKRVLTHIHENFVLKEPSPIHLISP